MSEGFAEPPRICLVDEENLAPPAALEGLSRVKRIAGGRSQLDCVLAETCLDLVILWVGKDEDSARATLINLAEWRYRGWVLFCSACRHEGLGSLKDLAEGLGLRALPPLEEPYAGERLKDAVAAVDRLPLAGADLKDALHQEWLELWYQPKLDTTSLRMRSVEALVRLRHPVLGLLPPQALQTKDPQLSEFVIRRVIADWNDVDVGLRQVEVAINLPMDFFRTDGAAKHLAKRVRDGGRVVGLLVEIDSVDINRDLQVARVAANQLRSSGVAISIDDVAEDWPALIGVRNFPFVEIKADRSIVLGCADDSRKHFACSQIVRLAGGYGARSVAEGVDNWADFLAVREIGFDLVQGFHFAQSMPLKQLARSCWAVQGNAMASERFRSSLRLPDINQHAVE